MSKILIVEDDFILAKAINDALTAAGFETGMSADGEDGLAKMKREKFDLVLLDLLLPKKSGEQVLAEMKKDENLKFLPVLVSTVKADPQTISRCAALGIRGYFIKSDYSLEEILNKVKEALAEKK